MRKHIFNAGPCKLPDSTLENVSKAVLEFGNTGQSIMEVSHRSADFQAVYEEAVALFKEVLNIPEGYSVLFLGGGASMQFCMIPFNFLKTKPAYVNTGTWSTAAIKEAKMWGEVEIVASSEADGFTYYPEFTIPSDVDYMHITSNNTIRGTEIFYDPTSPVPLICDMSSDICSRPVDVSKYAMIYGGVQKNIGPAGVVIVIIREDLIREDVLPETPTIMRYDVQAKAGSLFNTPPCYGIYICGKVFKWLKKQGGLEAMKVRNERKAKILYDYLDQSKMFHGTVRKEDRSIMNVPFVTGDKDLDALFVKEAEKAGFVNLKGHRTVGGMRASIYNAMPEEGVVKLVEFMKKFEAEHANA